MADTEEAKILPLKQPSEPQGAKETVRETRSTERPVQPDAPSLVHDLSSPTYYLNRELTWLVFNERVLHEAEDDRTPLLERLKFLSIIGSNLDEFFMKRIGGLKQQVGAGLLDATADGLTPQEQITACIARTSLIEAKQQQLLSQIIEQLEDQGVVLASYADLDSRQKDLLRTVYFENVFPLVTPQSIDPTHPFPFISNLSLNLLVTLHMAHDPISFARVKVPLGVGIDRFIQLDDEPIWVPLEQVMAHNLDLLFPGMTVDTRSFFRITRNAISLKGEEVAADLLDQIESALRDRKFAPIVRLEISPNMDTTHRERLAAEFGLDLEQDVSEKDVLLGARDLAEIADLPIPELRDPPHHPLDHPSLIGDANIFHLIRDEGAVLLHHPYDSFATSVERLLREASIDPKVLAIKMTLYRTSSQSSVIRYLKEAAANGKQVAVVVELKARFDEAANIQWASQLEQVGIHVTYGVVGLKTHTKVTLIVRRDYSGLARYVHIATGNYNSETARYYGDLGLLTCDPDIGHDATELFNYLTTGYKPKRKYKKLLVAPKLLRPALLNCIEREVEHCSEGRGGYMRLKANALEDVEITQALYRASQACVRIDLLIRDSCRLRPGIPGLSDNITVLSTVGRFLEHARVYHFRNAGDDVYFIGSADLMKRNLDNRVEVLVPVEHPVAQEQLDQFLITQLKDKRSAWLMKPDGTYSQLQPSGEKTGNGGHEMLIEWAEKRHKEATRLRKRKTKGLGFRKK